MGQSPKFRFDQLNSRIIFLFAEGKTVCSFDEVLRQIIQITEHLPILDNIITKARERIIKQANEKQFQSAIHFCEDIGFSGSFYSYLYASICQYAIEQNPKCVHKTGLIRGSKDFLEENSDPMFDQLRTSLMAFKEMDLGFFPNQSPSSYAIQADVLSGETYYSSELSCVAFLIMFRDVLLSNGLTVCTCAVCGDVFCGKLTDNCCGSADCEKYIKSADPKQKKADLSKISKNFSLNVRQYRYRIKEKCNSPDAVQEFNTFTEPIQSYVVEKVKELRINDAPVKEIRKLKIEVDHKYAEINEKAKELFAKYSDEPNKTS